jgi:hypothetical protein
MTTRIGSTAMLELYEAASAEDFPRATHGACGAADGE